MIRSAINKYDYIDALRGWAILGVVLVHSSQAVAPNSEILRWFMAEGARGVQLFFVVSALALCMSWTARSAQEKSPVRNFFIRRFFRIAPMFYLAIPFYVFVNGLAPTYWAPNGIEWWFAPVTAAFIHGLHPETINSLVPGSWSIAAEVGFYLVLPFLLPHIKSIRAGLSLFVVGLLLCGLNLLLAPHIFSFPANQQYLATNFSLLNFFGQLPVFVLGILGYSILRAKYPRRRIAIAGGVLMAVLLPAFLYPALKLTSDLIPDTLFRASHYFIAGGMFTVFALLLANWPARLFVNRMTTALGKISFSMYLTHFALLSCFSSLGFSALFPKSDPASLLHFICVVLATAAVSFFFYTYIEKPGIALGNRLIDKLESD